MFAAHIHRMSDFYPMKYDWIKRPYYYIVAQERKAKILFHIESTLHNIAAIYYLFPFHSARVPVSIFCWAKDSMLNDFHFIC